MLTSINHPSWLFFLPLAQQASLLKDDLLDPVDDLLHDEELVALVRQCLATRYPQSVRTGRPGMAPDRLLRSCVLKHLKGWSFRGYWSIVENRRGVSQRVVQRQVLYLGEINDSQKAAWCQCIEVFDEPGGQWHQVMLFSEDREAPDLAQEVVHVRLYELKVLRPRQWGACWLSSVLWEQLRLDDFWRGRLGVSRERTD